jgi:hypothetical protein
MQGQTGTVGTLLILHRRFLYSAIVFKNQIKQETLYD